MSIQDAMKQRTNRQEQLRKIRRDATAEIDRLLEILDTIDGDPEAEVEDEREPDNDLEPALGSINPTTYGSQHVWSAGGYDDREGDPLDRGEEEHDGREEDDPGELADTGIADVEGLIEQCSETYLSGMNGIKAVV